VAACLPISVENTAIAYDAGNDRFKVDIEAMTVGTIDVNPSDRWARELGKIDLSRYNGSAVGLANAIHTAIVVSGAVVDPRDIRALTVSDIIKAYGSQDQALLQRATTYDSLVQLRHSGAEIDPRNIRVLTSSDVVQTVQDILGSLNVRIGGNTLPTGGGTDRYIVVDTDGHLQVDATATIDDITKTATEVQISNTFAGAGNYTVHTPGAGLKVQLKLLSLELSAAVDLGYRWTTTGTIYYLRTTAGPIATNFVGCNPLGGTNEALVLNASGACTVKGYALLEEV